MIGLKRAQETREHTHSYYAATANWPSDYPQLEGDISTDVVVVGGGFSGVSTAVELSERGFKVVLIEANRIGWGATGRNGGQVIGGVGNNPSAFRRTIGDDGVKAVEAMGVECVDIIRDRVAKYQIDCDLKWGYCEVGLKRSHLRDYREWAEEDQDARYLDADELKKYVNSDRYIGGCYTPKWGHVHPLNLCLGEAKAAQQQGTQIFEQTRVLSIEHGETAVLQTEKGRVKADRVVLCGNAYLGNLVPRLASRVLPSTSCIIATEPLTDEQVAQCLPGDVAVCDSRTALDYYRLSADKRMLFGGLANYTGLEPANMVEVMRGKMVQVFPALKDSVIDYQWSGQMGITLRRMPQVGRINEQLYYVQGYSGHGVAPTHVMGRILAEAIDGHSERFDLMASMRHIPWPGGRVLGRPVMALGMMYFKLLDEL